MKIGQLVDEPVGAQADERSVLGMNAALVGAQAPRFVTAVLNAGLRWLPGLGHIPISDDPGR